ncbi:hypothetical protein MXB_5231, partial [Myxobolus squamalis]
YKPNDQVIMLYENFYPEDNIAETYTLSSFQHCLGPKISMYDEYSGVFDAIQGLTLEQSGLDIKFG